MANHYPYSQFYYTPYLSPYYQQAHVSPFIPPVAVPQSPFQPPRDERRVHWEEDEFPPPRARRPSWHATFAPPPNPVPFPSPPVMMTPLPPVMPLATQPPPNYVHQRRRSDSFLPQAQPAWVAFPTMVHPYQYQPVMYQPPPSPPRPQIHPLLNGESAAGPLILFDLSLNTFSPQRVKSTRDKSGTPLTLEELMEPATHPAVHRMTIVCDALREWPIVLEPHTTARERSRERSPFLTVPGGGDRAPITLYDVLMALHRTVQRQISHVDWARLAESDATAVSRAYTRRCRTFPSAAAFEASQGVRRVDYLLDRYHFRGLMREPGAEGFEKMRLVTGAPP